MSDDIYQKDLLRLAAEATGAGRLDAPDASVTLDNPLCGDRVTLDVTLDPSGRVAEVGHHVRACVLCQASASIVGGQAAGESAAGLRAVASALETMLEGGAPPPDEGKWSDLQAFAPVAGHKSRHACVLLPFDALGQALETLASGDESS